MNKGKTAVADKISSPVPYVDLGAQFSEERKELMGIAERVFAEGAFVGGAAIGQLEEEIASFVGTRHAVAVNSGTDALTLAMRALDIGPGDEVITPPNSFVASTGTIVHVGAAPVFADVRDDQNFDPAAVEAAVTPRTKAIMPVHMTGRVCDMNALQAIADRHGLSVIEDAAQAMGSTYHGKRSGSFGDVGCFSAHPLKNLNACGDGGYVTTNDEAVAERIRRLRNHGMTDRNTVVEFGYVSRMDTLQAEILRMRLGRLASAIERRRRNVELYREHLDPAHVFIPPCRDYEYNTFVLFVVQLDRRDELQAHLADLNIGSAVHYPIPIHLQPAAASLGYRKGSFPVVERQAERILSLPHHQYLREDQVRFVADAVNAFYR